MLYIPISAYVSSARLNKCDYLCNEYSKMRTFLLLSVILLSASSCLSSGKKELNGYSYDVDGLTVLDLNGSWHQMGCQYGTLAKEKLDDVLAYLDLKLGGDAEKINSAAKVADSLYLNYPDYLKVFFDGASLTSGISPERLKLCNAVEYVEGVFLCSAMAAWNDYGTGKLVFGRNYDAASYREIDKDVVVTVFHPKNGIAAATVGYAGELYCVNGINAKGLFIELNNGMPSAGDEIHWNLCPSTSSLFNMLFEAESLDDVDSFFESTRSSLSSVIGVADKKEARSYEWCYDGVRRGDVMTKDGLMISTNHYVNPGWHFTVPTDDISWNSISRRSNLANKAEEYKGRIGVEKMKEIMSTPLEAGGPMHSLTRYQIVAAPEDMILHINIPSNGKWVELKMNDFFHRRKR